MADSSSTDLPNVPSSLDRPSPDARRRRRRQWQVGGGMVIVAALVAGGVWLATSGGDDSQIQQTPALPSAFGAYTEAKKGDTEWTEIGSNSVNTDITKGPVNLTYRASGGKALMISVKTSPLPADKAEPSDDTFDSIFDSTVDQTRVKTYPAGAVGGKIQCADITIGKSTFTTCGWHNDTTDVNLAPVLNHNLVVSTDAPADLRTFINTLKLAPE